MASAPAAERHRRQAVLGIVVSDKMQKTVVVEIARQVRHVSYNKMVRRKTRSKPTMRRTRATWVTRCAS
jgi:small subunit ribosomal protein S17